MPTATCPPIKVTTNSYGPSGGGDSEARSATVKLHRALAAEGVVTVWAAGNDASTWPDISAPGALDLGTSNSISGTSMAAPHIAGVVAQFLQADPSATPAEIEAAQKVTAHTYADGAAYTQGPAGTTSFDEGHGLVDVVAAVGAVR